MPAELSAVLGWLDSCTATLPELCAGDLTEPSPLPGWTKAHLLTHLARNADALGNLVTWARTGVPTPMYVDPEQRVADIEWGARRPADVIVKDVLSTAARLSTQLSELEGPQWTAKVRTVKGNWVPATRIPWLRVRELAVHAVDLGSRFADLPDDLVSALLADAVAVFVGREDCPPVRLRPPGGPTLTIGRPNRAVPTVQGTAPQLLGWVTGRTTGAGLVADGLPTLPPWL